jgi:hypothetical protein
MAGMRLCGDFAAIRRLIAWQAWQKDTPFDFMAAALVLRVLREVFCR